jgi:hypothetical protein
MLHEEFYEMSGENRAEKNTAMRLLNKKAVSIDTAFFSSIGLFVSILILSPFAKSASPRFHLLLQ